DQVRGSGSRRTESPEDHAMGHSLPDHGGAPRRGGDPTTGRADGLAGPGDQRPGKTAVVGGFAVGLPWGLVWGTALSSVEGRAAGDSAVLRAAGRSDPGIDPSGDAGVAGADAVRGLGAAGATGEWREAQGAVSRPGEASHGSPDSEARLGGDLPGGDD